MFEIWFDFGKDGAPRAFCGFIGEECAPEMKSKSNIKSYKKADLKSWKNYRKSQYR